MAFGMMAVKGLRPIQASEPRPMSAFCAPDRPLWRRR
jgi:hypothetical protein